MAQKASVLKLVGTPNPNGGQRFPHSTREAVDFLRDYHNGEGPYTLTSIVPDGPTTTRSFMPADEREMYRWIECRQGIENLYYQPNACRAGIIKKASKADIKEALAVHVEADPREGFDWDEERARILAALEAFEPPPSVIVD